MRADRLLPGTQVRSAHRPQLTLCNHLPGREGALRLYPLQHTRLAESRSRGQSAESRHRARAIPGWRPGRGLPARVRHHSCHKAITVTVARLNASLRAFVVLNCLACQLDAVLQGRIADELFGPYLLGQLLLGDDPVALL